MADAETEPKPVDQDTLVADIDRTRAELARTIDAISDRVSPKKNVERAADRLREQASQIDPIMAGAEAGAVVGSAASPLPSCGTRTRKIPPSPYGSALTSDGSSSSSVLVSVTSPSTGEYRSLTDLTDSTSPHGSPAVTAAPTAGRETYTTSPSCWAAYSVMPTDATVPSTDTHSCSAV